MQIHPTKRIFIGFAENCHLSLNFRTEYSLAIFTLSAKKLISTSLAIFGFLPSRKHDSVDIKKFLVETFREKIENNDKYFFFYFFTYFSKTIGFGSVFSAEMNSACKNTILSAFS